MKFSTLTESFAQIALTSSRTAITEQLAELFRKASPHEAQIIAYFSLGMLRPPYEGTNFSLADRTVAKIVAEVTGLTATEFDAALQHVGDLGLVAAAGGWKPTHDLTVLQVYEALHNIEQVTGAGSQELRSKFFVELLFAVSPQDASVIIRVVLGKLRLGFSDMTLIDALSWMLVGDKSLRTSIEHAYNICADIGHVAAVLREHGEKGIERMAITVGIPIRPAAAERLPSPEAVFEKLGACVAQLKLDGFRLQIHLERKRGKSTIRFFSRNLLDMSAMFPDLVAALEAWVDRATDFPIESCIMEGEAIVYDEANKLFTPFQETVKRRRKHGVAETAEELPLKLFIFDILYLNGASLLNEEHQRRRTILKTLLQKQKEEDPLQLIEERSIGSARELEAYFLEVIGEGLEGIVVKRIHATYQPGKRNFNWIKLKRHEAHALDDTIDAVILGYYYGQGKRAHFGIGSFLVGVYTRAEDRYETVAKVGTGLSDNEWRELKKQCDVLVVDAQPHNVLCETGLAPDVWVSPEKVVAIRADEITRSPIHTAGKGRDGYGFALRFPRMVGYRPDKNAEQATSVEEVRSLYKQRTTKLDAK